MSDPASELIAAGLGDLLTTWLTAAFGDGRKAYRGALQDLQTLNPEQTPALQYWASRRRFVDTSDNVPNTVMHEFTIRGLVRPSAGMDPSVPEQLLNLTVDALDQLWTVTKIRNVPCTINQVGQASTTWPGYTHGLLEMTIAVRYERMAQP